MASRSSVGVGMGVTVFILSVLTIGLLVLWAIYFTKYKDSQTALQTERAGTKDYIGEGEKNQDSVRRILAEAKRKNKTVVAFLAENQDNILRRVTGAGTDSIEKFEQELAKVKGAGGGKSLVNVIADRDAEIAQLTDQVRQAQDAQQTALANMQAESERVKQIEKARDEAVKTLTDQVNEYKSEVTDYRAGIDTYKAQLDQQLATAISEAGSAQKRLADQLQKLTEENLILKNQLLALREANKSQSFRAGDEAALVDATVVGVNGAEKIAFISIGENKKAAIGMSFAVYSDASAIRPDANGNYPRGKATLEIINVGPTSSTCRILSETRGNPVIAGDVVANAIYDPNKVYKFVTYGLFDINRDGIPTALERQDLEALITAWGGKVVDGLTGDVDFLILGESPVLPPQPPNDASQAAFEEFLRQKRLVTTYNDLYQQAKDASIPILNENRLYTLIGKTPARQR